MKRKQRSPPKKGAALSPQAPTGAISGAPVTPVASTVPATTDAAFASVMSPVPAVVSTDPNIVPVAPVTRTAPATTAAACDAEPTICAYASPPRSVAALADEEEEKEDPFPLRTYCGCKSEIHTDDDKDKGYGDWWRTFLNMKKKTYSYT